MNILSNYDLAPLNTLRVSVRAKFFVEVRTEEELQELFNLKEFKENKKLFLGGGSNILFTKDFDGIVVLNKLKGMAVLPPEHDSVPVPKDEVLVRAASGEIWHDLVLFTVSRGYWGVENLSLIPGTVGGAPMQNIGAYGAEFKDVLENVEAYAVADGSQRVFTKEECQFGYRDSIFKNSLKGLYFISAVTLRLSTRERKNISYKILQNYLKEHDTTVTSSKDVSDAVVSIRKSKLPDPALIGNAGSFFKNVFVDKKKLSELLEKYPAMPYFQEENRIKIPAAWLIEACGWKGKRTGHVGVHEKHALILVNYGGGTAEKLQNLAQEIMASVDRTFGLELVPEVNFI